MELTLKERLIISNQLKILEKLYPEEAKEYALHRKAIEYGYKLHYSWLLSNFGEEMPEEDCQEVLNVLNMYRAITFSYNNAKDKEGLDKSKIKFRGFDGNEEGSYFGYTLYFVVDLERFDELREGTKYPDFNSHIPMLPKYRRMLEIWNRYQDKHSLSIDQIKELLNVKD